MEIGVSLPGVITGTAIICGVVRWGFEHQLTGVSYSILLKRCCCTAKWTLQPNIYFRG